MLIADVAMNNNDESNLSDYGGLFSFFLWISAAYLISIIVLYVIISLNDFLSSRVDGKALTPRNDQSRYKTVHYRYHLMTSRPEEQCHIVCRCEVDTDTMKEMTKVKNCCTLCFRSGSQGYQEIASISESLKAVGRIQEEQVIEVSEWDELPIFIRLEAEWRLTFIEQKHRVAAA